ncbi:MAG: hypothetical protein ACO3F2_13860 [Roseiflexaceae bacterium]
MSTNDTPQNPGCGKMILNVLAWIYIPFIMIFVRWQTYDTPRRILGSIWAFIMFMALLNRFDGESNTSSTTQSLQPTRRPAAEMQVATDVPQRQSVIDAPAESQADPTARTAVDPCTFETNQFIAEITVVLNRSAAATSVMRKYQNAESTGYQMSDREAKIPVSNAYSEIQIIYIPSCRSEPDQIVNALYTIRDAQLKAFAAMGRQVDGLGTVDAAVREIENQLPIIDREVAKIKRLKDALE